MLQKSRLPLFLLGLALLTASAAADIITLKTGERIDAKIASETATELTLETQVSSGIKDERIVKKADVVKIDRVAPDEADYRAIMNLQPGKNSLASAQYDGILATLQAFAAKYPESAHLADVKQAAIIFQADKKRVDAGEIKFDGLWLSKAEGQRQRVQIGGMQYFNAMKNANATGDAIGALNAYATLEKNFAGSKVMPDAIDLARQLLAALKPAVERAIENQRISEQERLQGIKNAGASPDLDPANKGKSLTPEQMEQIKTNAAFAKAKQDELIAANQREQAQADAALAIATAAGQWPPFAGNSEKCLKAIQAKIPGEIARLEKIPVGPIRESIALAEKAQTEFTGKDYAAATETLKEVSKLWPTNELGTRLTAQITAAKNPPKDTPAATPDAATATAATKPGAATPAPKTAVATPAPGKLAPPTAPKTTTLAAATDSDTDGSETKSTEPAEPPKHFFMTVPGAVCIVVGLAVLLAGANIFSKIRQRRSPEEEP